MNIDIWILCSWNTYRHHNWSIIKRVVDTALQNRTHNYTNNVTFSYIGENVQKEKFFFNYVKKCGGNVFEKHDDYLCRKWNNTAYLKNSGTFSKNHAEIVTEQTEMYIKKKKNEFENEYKKYGSTIKFNIHPVKEYIQPSEANLASMKTCVEILKMQQRAFATILNGIDDTKMDDMHVPIVKAVGYLVSENEVFKEMYEENITMRDNIAIFYPDTWVGFNIQQQYFAEDSNILFLNTSNEDVVHGIETALLCS